MTHPSLTRRSALSLTGAGLLSSITLPAWAAGDMRPAAAGKPTLTAKDRQVVNRIRPQRALQDLYHLTEDIGQRYSGTPAENRAARYLAAQLEDADYDVRLQPFPVDDRRLGEISGPRLHKDLCWGVQVATLGKVNSTSRGRLVQAKTPTGEGLPEDLDGMIVMRVVEADSEDPTVVAELVAARGGEALVWTRTDGVPPRQNASRVPSLKRAVDLPVVGVGQRQKHELLALRDGARLTVTTVLHTGLTSYNVIGSRRGTGSRPRPQVMVCGHYDSVVGAKGANDDGSGTVLTLELARVLRRMKTEADLQFVLWGSEEIGLVGSRYYVSQLEENERTQLRGVFNNDMVGTSWDPAEKYWVLSYDGDPNPVNAQVLAAGERLGYRSQMSDVTERGSSDHQSFQEKGIASGNFSWRGVESPALLEPEYHSSDDTIKQNISMERLTVSMEIIGCATYALARG